MAIELVQAFFGFDDIAMVVAAIGTATSVVGGIMQAGAAKKAEKARAREAELRASRERMQQVRESIAKRAQVQQAAQNQGSAESSSAVGGAQGVVGQLNTNQGYIAQQQIVGEQLTAANQKIVDSQGIQTLGRGITKVGGSIFSNKDEIKDIFS